MAEANYRTSSDSEKPTLTNVMMFIFCYLETDKRIAELYGGQIEVLLGLLLVLLLELLYERTIEPKFLQEILL